MLVMRGWTRPPRTTTLTSTSSDFPMSFNIPLPQELVGEVINNLTHNTDAKSCSLVSKGWGYPARKRLFHYIHICPGVVEGWLSRSPESVQRMAPHIVKFELSDKYVAAWEQSFSWEGPLTQLISSLAPSPVRWLKIERFGVGCFNKTTLEQCFKPICHSLRSLMLDDLTASPEAMRYLISLFPNLEDIEIGVVPSMPTESASEWAGCGIKHSQRLSGTFRTHNWESRDDLELLTAIASLSPRFRVISLVEITSLNWAAMRGLMEACSETLESAPLVWWEPSVGMYCYYGLFWWIFFYIADNISM